MTLLIYNTAVTYYLQYCAKVMQATKVHLKVRMNFHGIWSDNSLEQRAIFLRTFIQLKKICEHKR